MVEIICDDSRTKTLLSKLHDLALKQDAYFHKDMIIACRDGDFSIHSASPIEEKQTVLLVPPTMFLPIEQIAFGLKDEKICVESYTGLQNTQAEVLEVIAELYSATDKFTDYKTNSIINLYFDDEDVFNLLMTRFSKNPFGGSKYRRSQYSSRKDRIFLRNFVILRSIWLQESETFCALPSNVIKGGVNENFILPFIEYFNHHPNGYRISGHKRDDKDYYEAQIKAYSASGTNELSFCYGASDCLQQFLFHGYVEENSTFVRSIPMVLEIAGFPRVEIDAQAGVAYSGIIPDSLKDLKFYLPNIKRSKDKTKIHLSTIKIPQLGAPQSIRRIFRHVFSDCGQSEEQIRRAVSYVEHEILQRNIKYYEELQTAFANFVPKDSSKIAVENAKRMIEVQLQNIKSYPFYAEAMAA